MELLNNILGDNTISAFGISVMHSLWIGALISALTALLFSFIKKSNTRYSIAITSMALICISTLIVFLINNRANEHSSTNSLSIQVISDLQLDNDKTYDEEFTGSHYITNAIQEIIRKTERIFVYHSDLIVMIWIIGVLILGFKFLGAYFYADRFRKRYTIDINDIWAARIEKIAEKIDLKTRFRTVKSAIISNPVVTGWLKPVFILPASVLAGIPVEQVEAIIAHELAHIKRNDYLVNIIQSFVEIIMFYNPAIWWLSGIIRTERENSCDDIALQAGIESLVYAKALVSMHEISQSTPALSLAFKGNNNLLNRIKRITAMKEKTNYVKEKMIAVLGIAVFIMSVSLSLGFVSCATTRGSDLENNESNFEQYQSIYSNQDTLRDKKTVTINTSWIDPSDNIRKDVRMSIEHGEVIELYIDDEQIPENQFDNYRDLIDNTIDEYEDAMQELEDLDLEELEKEVEEAMKEMEQIDIAEIEKDIAEALSEMEQIDIAEIEKDIAEALSEMEQIDIKEIEIEIENAMKEIEKIDYEELEKELEKARLEMGNIDIATIEKEIEKARLELQELDMEEIHIEIEEAMKEMKEVDVEELKKEIEKAMIEIQEIDIEEIKKAIKEIKKDNEFDIVIDNTDIIIDKFDIEDDSSEVNVNKSKSEKKKILNNLESKVN